MTSLTVAHLEVWRPHGTVGAAPWDLTRSSEQADDQAVDIVGRNAAACQTIRRAINRWIPWGFRRLSRVCLSWGPIMMGRPPRTPTDLQALTRDIRNRCACASGNIELIAQDKNPIFQDPRQIMLELVLARHEIEAAISIMKKGWWP